MDLEQHADPPCARCTSSRKAAAKAREKAQENGQTVDDEAVPVDELLASEY